MVEQGIAIRGGIQLTEGGLANVADPVAGCASCCPGAACPCVVATTVYIGGFIPGLDVTISWTGAQVNRNWGKDSSGNPLTWTNGETKSICGGYQCTRVSCPTTSAGFEILDVGYLSAGSPGGIRLTGGANFFCTGPTLNVASDRVIFRGVTTVTQATLLIKNSYLATIPTNFGYSSRVNISTDNFGTYLTNFTVADEFIEAGHFGGGATGQVTDTNGITYTWTLISACPGLGTLC